MALLPNTRRSWPVKVAALAFIGLILIGNYWIFLSLFGKKIAPWLYDIAGLLIATELILIPVIFYMNSIEPPAED